MALLFQKSMTSITGRRSSLLHCTVDDVQQMCGISGNAAYGTNFEHNRDPVQQDEHAYSDIELGQEQEMSTSAGHKTHGTGNPMPNDDHVVFLIAYDIAHAYMVTRID